MNAPPRPERRRWPARLRSLAINFLLLLNKGNPSERQIPFTDHSARVGAR
jgi:hypothetical protein